MFRKTVTVRSRVVVVTGESWGVGDSAPGSSMGCHVDGSPTSLDRYRRCRRCRRLGSSPRDSAPHRREGSGGAVGLVEVS